MGDSLLKHVAEGKTKETRRRGRRRKQLLVYLTDTKRYWNLKREHYFALSGELVWQWAMELS